MRNLTIILTTLVTFGLTGLAHAGSNVQSNADAGSEKAYWMKFKANTKEERTEIANLGVSIEGVVEDNVIAIGYEAELEAAKKSGRLLVSFPLTAKMLDFPPEDSLFHNYTELMAKLQELQQQYPNLITLSSIGRSLEGREIPLLTFAGNTASTWDGEDLNRPAVYFMGGHHAREHLSIETPLNLAIYLAQNYGRDARVTELLNTRTVYISPMINPDGAEYDIASGSYRLWRKNRRENSGGTMGVDLNRNYSFGWGGGGSSGSSSSDIYRGPSALSEPETQAVARFFETHPNVSINLSFHTFSALILYPWGHKYETIENQNDYLVHKTMAETMAGWNGYTPQQSSELYIASGDTSDWGYGQMNRISFTFELDPEMSPDKQWNPAAGFYPGQEQIAPTFQKNVEPCLYLIEYSDNPYRVLEPKYMAYGLSTPLVD